VTGSPGVGIATAPAGSTPPSGGEVLCPLCGYNLRGLAEPRCPECGYRFVWADISDPARRLHRYLFEHHPERNAWSFARTLIGGLRPRTFWTSLHPAQPSRLGRLVLYWALAASLLVAVVAGHYGLWLAESAVRAQANRATLAQGWPVGRRQPIERQFGTFENYLDTFQPVAPDAAFYRRAWEEERGWTLLFAGFWLVWPWVVVLTLAVLFRLSMRRARIRTAHVLRCAVYGFDAVAWLAGVAALALGVRAANWYGLAPKVLTRLVPAAPLDTGVPTLYRPDIFTDTLFWGGLAAVVLTSYRLASALRHYLRFDHAAATVTCAELVAALLLTLAVLEGWPGLRNWAW
jgi:hypothetical protein